MRLVREHDAPARRCERRCLRADVRDVTHRLRRLLDRNVERLVAVQDSEGDRLVELRMEVRRDGPEGDDDRQLGRDRPEAQRADPELIPAVGKTRNVTGMLEREQEAKNSWLHQSCALGKFGKRERGPSINKNIKQHECAIHRVHALCFAFRIFRHLATALL